MPAGGSTSVAGSTSGLLTKDDSSISIVLSTSLSERLSAIPPSPTVLAIGPRCGLLRARYAALAPASSSDTPLLSGEVPIMDTPPPKRPPKNPSFTAASNAPSRISESFSTTDAITLLVKLSVNSVRPSPANPTASLPNIPLSIRRKELWRTLLVIIRLPRVASTPSLSRPRVTAAEAPATALAFNASLAVTTPSANARSIDASNWAVASWLAPIAAIAHSPFLPGSRRPAN